MELDAAASLNGQGRTRPMIPAFYFERRKLERTAKELRSQFAEARPFKHIVIDDFLPRDILAQLIGEFPASDDPRAGWQLHGPGRTAFAKNMEGNKLATSEEEAFGAFTRHFMAQLNSATFLRFIEELTGVTGLLVDPGYGGCGMHSTGAGGRLMIHTDVNRHTVSHAHLHQVLNAIVYLNEDWKDEYAGHLELWNRARQPEASILPIANRFVLFATGTKSLHGHPRPLTPPPGRRRNSLAVYYYVLDRPTDEDYGGFQTSVEWLPTEREDFQFLAQNTQALLDTLNAAHGRSMLFPKSAIPKSFLPDAIMNAFPGDIPLLFLDWERFERKPLFVETHLRGLSPDRRAQLRPFAVVGTTSVEGVTDPRAMALLMDTSDGKAYLCSGNHVEPVWIGYGEVLFRAALQGGGV